MQKSNFIKQAANLFSGMGLILFSFVLSFDALAQPASDSGSEDKVDKVYFVLKETPKSSGQIQAEYWVGDCSIPSCRIKVLVDSATKIENYSELPVGVTALQKYKYYEAEYINFVPLNPVMVKSIKIDI